MKEKVNIYACIQLQTYIQNIVSQSKQPLNYSSDIIEGLFVPCFGSARLRRICELYQIDLMHLTIETLAVLFSGLANVTITDLQELYNEIINNNDNIRHLSTDQTQQLRASLKDISNFNELTKDHVDALMFVLVPFASLEDIFLKKIPTLDPKAKICGKNTVSLMEVAYINNYLRLCDDLTSLERIMFYAKRLTDREPPVGLIIPHELGYYEVRSIIHGSVSDGERAGAFFEGGAYVTGLKAITRKMPDFTNMLLFRGTRINQYAQDGIKTLFDNCRKAQGSDGAMQVFHRIFDLVNDPTFLEPNELFSVLGMSLGGAHAARIAAAFYDRTIKFELVSAVGLEDPTLDYYAEKNRQLSFTPHLVRVLEIEETVPHLGDGHLGRGCTNLRIDIYGIECSSTAVSLNNDARYIIHRNIWPDTYFTQTKDKISALTKLGNSLADVHIRNAFERGTPTIYHLTQEDKSLVAQLLTNSQDSRSNTENLRSSIIPFQHTNKYLYFLLAYAERHRYDGLGAKGIYITMTLKDCLLQSIRQSIYNYSDHCKTQNRHIIEDNEIEMGLNLLISAEKSQTIDLVKAGIIELLQGKTNNSYASPRNAWNHLRSSTSSLFTKQEKLPIVHFLLIELNFALPQLRLFDIAEFESNVCILKKINMANVITAIQDQLKEFNKESNVEHQEDSKVPVLDLSLNRVDDSISYEADSSYSR